MGRGLGVSAGLGVGEGLAVQICTGCVTVAAGVGVSVGGGCCCGSCCRGRCQRGCCRGSCCRSRCRRWRRELRAISASVLETVHSPDVSTPNDHFTAGPDCSVSPSGVGRVGRASRSPTIRINIVSPPVTWSRSSGCSWLCSWLGKLRLWVAARARDESAPDDHFTASPHCRVTVSGSGRVGRAGGRPTIRAGIVSPAGVEKVAGVSSAPDDHFTAGPHCRVTVSGSGRVGGAGGRPTIGAGIVSPAGVQIVPLSSTPPQTIISLPVHTAV